jgi:hypothetical protein
MAIEVTMASAKPMIGHVNLFAPLAGQTAQGCWLGYGSVLFLEFGAPQPLRERENRPKGEFGLSCDWIEWRIEQRGHILAGSEDDRSTMESAARQIDGKAFVSGQIVQPSGDSILAFTDDLVLRTFVISSEEDARWTFRDHEGKYFYLGLDRAHSEGETPLQVSPRLGMTQSDASALQDSSKLLWNSEVERVVVSVQHRFEDGYEPSDLDSLSLEFRQALPGPEGRKKHRQVGALRIDASRCGLRLELAGQIIAACGDSSEKVLAQFKGLVGKTLSRINISSPGGDADFVLEDGLVLRCFRATCDSGSWHISTAIDDSD